jgi:hypothetical protein
VYVLLSPRAFATDSVTGRLPDKIALMPVRSTPYRLANAVWLPRVQLRPVAVAQYPRRQR